MTHNPDDQHPVDSTTRTCCGGIGRHTPDCDLVGRPTYVNPRFVPDCRETKSCTSWCVDAGHPSHDPACWGPDHYVALTLEEGYPVDAVKEKVYDFDPPRIGPHAYRSEPGRREIVRLHLYRPSDRKHRNLDDDLRLTVDEARQLVQVLHDVIDEIEAAR